MLRKREWDVLGRKSGPSASKSCGRCTIGRKKNFLKLHITRTQFVNVGPHPSQHNSHQKKGEEEGQRAN